MYMPNRNYVHQETLPRMLTIALFDVLKAAQKSVKAEWVSYGKSLRQTITQTMRRSKLQLHAMIRMGLTDSIKQKEPETRKSILLTSFI